MTKISRFFLILALLQTPVFAVTFDAETDTAGVGTSISFSHTVTSGGSNRAVGLCILVADSSTVTISAITYAGVTMTSHSKLTDTSCTNECFKLVNPTTGINTVAATLNESKSWTAVAFSATDVDQAAPFGSVQTNIGIDNTESSLVVSSAVGDLVWDSIIVQQDTGESGTLGLGTGQTSNMSRESTDHAMSSSREAGAANVTMSWTWGWGFQNLAHMAFNIVTSTASKAPLFKRYYDLLRSSLLRKEGLSSLSGLSGLAFSEVKR